jgi:hypothetical protein
MRRLALLLFVISTLTLGCRPELPRCEVDEQCPTAQLCVDGDCVDPGPGSSTDAGDQDPDAGPNDGDDDGGIIAPVDAGADAGELDDGRDPDAGPGEPFDSGQSPPPVNNGRDAG